MRIDWTKAEEKPNGKQKVKGHVLLKLRSKINDLERELAQKNNVMTTMKANFAKIEEDLINKMEKLSSSESELKIKLAKANSIILQIEEIHKVDAKKKDEFEKTILHRNKVIESLEDDFEKRITEIEDLKKEIKDLKDELEKTQIYSKLIKKMQDIMLQKGFISDKEFYQLLHKMEKKYASIDL
jgi:chromosome segregation ATPase